MRTFDPAALEYAVEDYKEELYGFNARDIAADTRNIVLYNETRDVAIFERFDDTSVFGHYFFKSRGRKAIISATAFINELWEIAPELKTIRGLTPINKLGALWMNRHLGFGEYGEIDTIAGRVRLVKLSRSKWDQNKENIT